MINLIPPDAQKLVIQEYWFRVGSIWSLLFAIVCIFLALLLLPTYVLVHNEHNLTVQEIAKMDIERVNAAVLLETEIKSTNELARTLLIHPEFTRFSEVVEVVDMVADEGILIGNYELIREGLNVKSVRLQGTARSREALSEFTASLEKQTRFAKVEVPISSLVRDQNLPFVVSITMNPQI